MNTDTTTLIDRTYAEIVDDLLTAIVGGVVNEPIIFDVKSLAYPLAEPARAIRSIKGQRLGSSHIFRPAIDFLFSEGDNSVVWQDKADMPDDDTIFYVDYFRRDSRSPLTDINVGSVTRTLSEAIGREIATVYQQIQAAYLSGFIDTATGKALDFVVSILNVTRTTKDFARGDVTFFRDVNQPSDNITIPQGTSLATTKGDATFHTTDQRTLQRGQLRIDVPVRADAAFPGGKGLVGAGEITVVAQRILGIARVTNFDPTILAAEDETDEQLRVRAKAAARGLGKATIAALLQAIFQNHGTPVEVADPNTTNGRASDPGKVVLLVEAEAKRFLSLQTAVDQTRAAGVLTTVVSRLVFLTPRVTAKITPGLTGPGKQKIQNDIVAALQAYIDGLASGAPAKGQELVDAIQKVKDVSAAAFADVRTSVSDPGTEGADPLVEALVPAIQAVDAKDAEALRTAIKGVIDAETPALLPSGGRNPDRSVIQGLDKDGTPTGQPATDTQIAAAKFQIVPPAGFSVTLDMEPADVITQES